jgi:beta-aspartyl-peptidase (threonine type)
MEKTKFSLVIHGGAGVISKNLHEDKKQYYIDGLEIALRIGFNILEKGGTAIDAVEMVVKSLEDNPWFNAGKGAVYTSEEKHELDASIMDGSNLKCGAVGGVMTVKNPISLARMVMEKTNHVMLIGEGAEALASKHSLEIVDNSYFDTTNSLEKLKNAKAQQAVVLDHNDEKKGTVGAVALDIHGNLAAATSTGGNRIF